MERRVIELEAGTHGALFPAIETGEAKTVHHRDVGLGIDFAAADLSSSDTKAAALTIGLIDRHRFSQECLIKAFEGSRPEITIVPFMTIQDCIRGVPDEIDLLIYYSHASDPSDAATTRMITLIREAFPAIPLVVMSDAEDACQSRTVRGILRSGARGFIPTRTTGIPIALAAIRFIEAGGTFAPLDLLMSGASDRAPVDPDPVQNSRLTSRQMAVLSHLRQGKANKTIAHDLGMSESTVKVHVRNIMRSVGASNRTQAAFKAQGLCDGGNGMRESGL
jgi:DNA-binding NarL/FixJ family response regulator